MLSSVSIISSISTKIFKSTPNDFGKIFHISLYVAENMRFIFILFLNQISLYEKESTILKGSISQVHFNILHKSPKLHTKYPEKNRILPNFKKFDFGATFLSVGQKNVRHPKNRLFLPETDWNRSPLTNTQQETMIR